MGARENKWQISQNYILHMKFSEFYLCFHDSPKIWHLFSRTTLRNFLWCYYRWLRTSLTLEKCTKRDAIFFNKIFWYKVFVHWIKLKLLNFLVDFVFLNVQIKMNDLSKLTGLNINSHKLSSYQKFKYKLNTSRSVFSPFAVVLPALFNFLHR